MPTFPPAVTLAGMAHSRDLDTTRPEACAGEGAYAPAERQRLTPDQEQALAPLAALLLEALRLYQAAQDAAAVSAADSVKSGSR